MRDEGDEVRNGSEKRKSYEEREKRSKMHGN
jgi:hypothetical protein